MRIYIGLSRITWITLRFIDRNYPVGSGWKSHLREPQESESRQWELQLQENQLLPRQIC